MQLSLDQQPLSLCAVGHQRVAAMWAASGRAWLGEAGNNHVAARAAAMDQQTSETHYRAARELCDGAEQQAQRRAA